MKRPLEFQPPVQLILASDHWELGGLNCGKPLRARSVGVRWARLIELSGQPTLLVANGPGRNNALRGLVSACRRFRVKSVISAGLAGALDPGLRVGDPFIVQRVIEFATRVEYPVRLPSFPGSRRGAIGDLLTLDDVAQDAGVKFRLRATGADAVDMETSAVAAEASRRGLPFYGVRVISDEAGTSFPVDFNRARRPDGTFSGWRICVQAGVNSGRWRRLMALRRDVREAAGVLGSVLRGCRFDNQAQDKRHASAG